MDKLVIYDNEYFLPKELTIKKWGELMILQESSPSPKQLVATTLNVPVADIELVPDETFELLIGYTLVLLQPPHATYNKTLGDNGKLIKFRELKLGEYIDLEVYISNGVGKHIVDICSILYQTQLPDTTTITDVYKAYMAFINYKTMLNKQYAGLFEIEGYQSLDPAIKEEIQEDSNDVARTWYNVVMIMCDNQILKMADIVKLSVIECFNWLAWNKDKQQEKVLEMKKQQQMLRR
jgi:hypothetical protein